MELTMQADLRYTTENRVQVIQTRPIDGYVNASSMCKAAGKIWTEYRRLKSTADFLEKLSSSTRAPKAELIKTVVGGRADLQGTRVHPQVAAHLAQWLLPRLRRSRPRPAPGRWVSVIRSSQALSTQRERA